MTVDEAVQAFSSLPTDAQTRFLALFGHGLTIAARDTYEFQATGINAPERLRAINEIQHRVLAHIHSLLTNGEWRYPDDALVSIMLDHDDKHLHDQVMWVFQDAMKKCNLS